MQQAECTAPLTRGQQQTELTVLIPEKLEAPSMLAADYTEIPTIHYIFVPPTSQGPQALL